MKFEPARSLFGTNLVTPRGKKFKLSTFDLTDDWQPVVKHSKIGFESKGVRRASIPCEYDSFDVISPEVIVLEKDKKHGLLLKDGIVFDANFDIFEVVSDKAIVGLKSQGKYKSLAYGIVDIYSGKTLLDCTQRFIYPNYAYGHKKLEGFTLTDDSGRKSIVSAEGKTIVPYDAKNYSEQYFNGKTYYTYIASDNKTHFVDLNGTSLISTYGFFQVEDRLVVAKSPVGTRIFEPTEKGSLVCTLETDEDVSFVEYDNKGEPVYKLRDKATDCHMIVDKNLTQKSNLYGDILNFDHSYLRVTDPKTGLYGLIDNENYDLALPCEYDDLNPLNGRPNFACKNDLWGVLGPDLQPLISFRYEKQSMSTRDNTLEAIDTKTGRNVSVHIGGKRITVSGNEQGNDSVQKIDIPTRSQDQ